MRRKNFVHLFIGILLFFFYQQSLHAQGLPNSQVFLFNLASTPEGRLFLENPKWLTSFNPSGYNNQPAFINGLWYLSVRLPEEEQNEIVALDMNDRKLMWITETPESEYSPSAIPGNSGITFSVVRVEMDSSQVLYKYDLTGEKQLEPLVKDEKLVAYSGWLSNNKVALVLDNDPVSLVLADIELEKTDFVTSRIGRCLKSNALGELFFTQKITEEAPWQIKKISKTAMRPKFITTTPGQNQDFELLEDGTILIGSGSKLFRYRPGISTTWEFIADLALYGAKNISRISVNDFNEIAIVFNYE